MLRSEGAPRPFDTPPKYEEPLPKILRLRQDLFYFTECRVAPRDKGPI